MKEYERSKPGPAKKVIIKWKASNKWSIEEIFPIESKTLIPSYEPPKGKKIEDLSGFFVEVQDESGAVLYRRIMRDPSLQFVEAPNEDGSFTNYEVDVDEKQLMIIIPDLPEGHIIKFYSSNNREGRCKEIGSLSLADIK